jgi:dTDP-4-dehydrorhamnose 3,5-epimerase
MKKKLNNKNFFQEVVIVQKIKRIKQSKGDVHKFVDTNSSLFKSFGEIYFTEVKKNYTKGWKKHKKTFSLIKIIIGKIQFIFFYKEKFYSIYINHLDNVIIQIPPKIWYAFKGLRKKNLLSNMINKKHSDTEVETKSIKLFNEEIKDNEKNR